MLLTPEGRQTVLASLNVSQLPAKPKPTWPVLKKSLLLARSLGLPAPGQAFSKAGGFKAAVLGQKFDLPLGDYPDLKSVKLELTRKLLGMGPKEKITVATVKTELTRSSEHASEREDHHRHHRRPCSEANWASIDRPIRRKCSTVSSPGRSVPGAMMKKNCATPYFADWITGQIDGNFTDRRPSSFAAPALAALRLPSPKVQAAAEECASGRFGDNKVFIIHVWRALQNDPDFRGMDLPAFKQHLAEANNARLLDLSRADLVQAMDPDDVRLSEVTYLNAAFHFIRIGSERH